MVKLRLEVPNTLERTKQSSQQTRAGTVTFFGQTESKVLAYYVCVYVCMYVCKYVCMYV